MYKICFISTVPATMRGLILPFVNYILNNYENEYDISLICCNEGDFIDMIPNNVHYYPIEMKRGIDFHLISVISQFKSIFKKENFDLIQYSTPNASFYASTAAKSAKVPNRLYCQWGLAFQGYSGYKRKAFKLLEKTTCKNSTWIEPDSNGNLNLCRSLGFYDDKKSSVVLHGSAKGVDLSYFNINNKEQYRKETREKYKIPDDIFVFGFVGSITGDKGINELISAFKKVNEEFPNTILMLVGDTEKEYSLDQNLMAWAEENDAVILTGLSRSVPKEMAAMDCYITASYREGFGTTVIEAGAMALPVISSNIPGPTDVIKDGFNGLVFENKNVVKLKDAMIKIYSDVELRKKFSKNALQTVIEKYDQNVVFEAMVADRKRLLNTT